MFRSLATSAVALLAGAAPLLAEVTPAEVWENLSRYYTDMGYDVAIAATDDAGGTLTLSEIVFSTDSETTELSIVVPKMTLQQTGDAKVRTIIDGPVSADMVSKTVDDEDVNLSSVITVPGNEMLSSGSAGDMLHVMTYPTIEISARFDTDETAGAGADMPVRLVMTGVAGEYRSNSKAGQQSTYDLAAKGLDLTLSMTDPDTADGNAGSVTATSHVDGLTASGSMIAPEGKFDMVDNPHEAFRAGMVVQGGLALGAVTGEAQFSGTDAEGMPQNGSASFASDSSELLFSMSREGVSYGGSAKGTEAEMTVGGLPFPISYAIETASGMLNFPISKSDEPQPYKLSYSLSGLTLADGIWAMFDPQGALPRDPANLTVDLEGEARVTEDLLDPTLAQRMAATMEETAATDGAATDQPATGDEIMPEMPMPFTPETVRIKQFLLEAVGARADLSGDLTIPEGAEQPVGTVEGSFTGLNALLDKLVSMGFVPQEQVMGARMMLAMFARPVEGKPDELQTSLEFRENGSIFANGQQVK
ncbi:DUF2125 domain-containing protein [Paracoccus marinaquae]|uniref:DUF2125 domain-containing protein n=1 Tax=Paracoccus marinaquae TaxID=2841926 RepID=A0ABS6AF91_9RHOB|nr:DUF2125 domain-containing protein [Paracoccus marinaquae]MBU3029164.1 DUF2125 domain-containing protein [Paracoccus marinaquae]